MISMAVTLMPTGTMDQVMRMTILMKKVSKKDCKARMTYSCSRKWSYLVFPRVKTSRSLLFPNKPR